MNIKALVGLIVPLVVVICLVILSSTNAGISVEKQTVRSIPRTQSFTDLNKSFLRTDFPIQTITITNSFFLPEKYVLPKLVACVVDKEGNLYDIDVRYSGKSWFLVRWYHRDKEEEIIEIPAKSKKQVKVFVNGVRLKTLLDPPSDDYVELLLVESKGEKKRDKKRDPTTPCQYLEDEELDSATHIPLSE